MQRETHDFLALQSWVQRAFRDAVEEDVIDSTINAIYADDVDVGLLYGDAFLWQLRNHLFAFIEAYSNTIGAYRR